MSERIKHWLAAPAFQDEDRTRAANLLNIILLTLVAITLVYLVLAPWTREQPAPIFITSAVLMPLLLAGLVLIRRGRVKVVGIALTAVLWIVFTAIATAAGGVGSPSLLNYTTVILIAALVLGGRAGIVSAALSIAASLALLGADLHDLLPVPTLASTKTSTWTVLAANLAVAAVLLRLATRDIREARERMRRNQFALTESEARYRSLFRDSPISLWEEDFSAIKAFLDDLRGSGVGDLRAYLEEHREIVAHLAGLVKIMSVNQTTLDLFAARNQEDLLRGLEMIFVQESLDVFRHELFALAEGKTQFKSEAVHRTLAGRRLHVLLSLAIAPGYEDTWSKVFVSLVDITERKEAEEALAKSEERFRRIAENAPDIVFRWSVEHGLEYISPAVLEQTGYTPGELMADPMLGFGVATGQDPDVIADYQRVIVEGVAMPAREFAYLRKDGSTGYLDVRSAAVQNETGQTVAFEGILRDVTERRRTEEALRDSEEQFRSLFENAVMGLYRSTSDGQLLMANPAMVRMLGYSSFEEVAKLNLEETNYAPGHSRAAFRQQIEAEGQIIGLELAWQRPDGSIIFIRENAGAIRDSKGKTLYYEGTIEDITEQKRALEALQENEQRYRALFERTNDAVFILDLEGHHIVVNRRAADLLGYTQEEMIGMLARQIVVPDEHSHSHARLAALLAGESLPVYERTFLRKDGTEVPVEINAALVYDPDGRPLHIQSVVRDIRGRKRAEAERERLLTDLIHRSTQLVTAADVSKSASTILDPGELIVETVDLIQERFGFYYVGLFLVDEAGAYALLRAGTGQAGQEMLAAGHKLVVGGESMIGTCVAHAEPRVALDVGEEPVRFDNPFLPQTRSELALPLISRGECLGALTVQSAQEDAFSADDIAGLQSLADQLAIALSNARLYDEVQRYATRLEDLVTERTAELAAVNKELEAFAYSVSHDLRAPLRSVDGFGQALLEDYARQLDATGQDYVQRMRAASQRMGQLIDDMLKLSRLTRRELRRELVDLSALATSIIAGLHGLHPERQVEFVVAEEAVAFGDEHLLRVMLENLLGNAWKFTSKQPQARIQFGVNESDGERVYFVRDDGAGFDMSYVNKLFTPFQRLHGVTEFEGSGVGLATVQRVIHRHGGRVWAEGAEGQGATFFFTLSAKGGETT